MTTTRSLLSVVLIAATLGPWRPGLAATPLGLVGSDDALWVYRVLEPEPDGARQLKFAYALPGEKEVRFRVLPMTPAGGDVVAAAACGQHLHVFFADGTHYWLRPPPPPRRPGENGKNDFPGVNLPGNQLPLAVSGDDETGALAAVVPVETARLVAETAASNLRRRLREAAETKADRAGDDTVDDAVPHTTDTNGPLEPAPPLPATGFALVEYTGSAWRVVQAIPPYFNDQTFCRIAARGGGFHLVFAGAAAPQVAQYATLSASGAAWSAPDPIPDLRADEVLDVLAVEETVVILVRQTTAQEGCLAVRALVLRDGSWHADAPLALDGAPLVCADGTPVVHRFQDRLALARLVTERNQRVVQVGLWALDGGEPVAALGEVTAMRKSPDHAARERWRMVVAYVAIIATLAVVFLRRQDSFLTDLPAPSGFVLAGLGRRFVAFVIDLAVVAGPVAALVVAPWLAARRIPVNEELWIEINNVTAQDPDALYWPWMAAMGLYVLYAILFEAAFAATPGKLLTGLRVVGRSGGRPGWGAIVTRNVLRFELYFMLQLAPTAIIVAITRNRQRLGDLVARTIVVQKADAE